MAFDQDAISRDFHSCFNENDITNDYLRYESRLGESILASDNRYLHVPHFVVELEELLFFEVVTRSCEKGDESNSEVNRSTLNPFVSSGAFALLDQTDKQSESGCNKQNSKGEIFPLTEENRPKSSDLWEPFLIGPEANKNFKTLNI